MAISRDIGIDARQFRDLARAYRQRWGIELLAASAEGRVVLGRVTADQAGGAARQARRHAIAEALRWGEPTVSEYPGGPRRRLLWAVPLMCNTRLLGGLVAIVTEQRVLPRPSRRRPSIDIRRACEDLRKLAEQVDITNAALLLQRRLEYQREQKRAEAIQDIKTQYFYSLNEVYLREEPALIRAVRKGDRGEARGILNRILVQIYYLADNNPNLVKSLLMELVVTMCRTAVESGGDPQELLGANFASISELSAIQAEEDLSHWLVQMLERIMDAIQRHRAQPSGPLIQSAMKYLAEHFSENISRDDVAREAGLSPSHLSRVVKKRMGRGFSDLLNQLRIDRAIELLRRTNKGLLQIALEVGYNDQSYFTKVFRRYMRQTPREFRRTLQQ